MPRMIVVAGPPGSGKSSAFPVSNFGVAYFNVDDRAAELNGGSYFGIPKHIRQTVNRESEAFVLNSIARNESFAIETTLRFEQAQRAKAARFITEMPYLALRRQTIRVALQSRRSRGCGNIRTERRSAVFKYRFYWLRIGNHCGALPQTVLKANYDCSASRTSNRCVLK